MSFLSCSPKHLLEATLSACKDPSPTPHELFTKGIPSRLSTKAKSPTIIGLKNSRNSRLSLRKVQSSKSLKDISIPSLTESAVKKFTKEDVRRANEYGFFQWRPIQIQQRNMRSNEKRVSMTYLSPQPKKLIENKVFAPITVPNMFSKQSMTTQPSIMQVKQSMSSVVPPLRAGPFFDAQHSYFAVGTPYTQKKPKELQQKVSFTSTGSPVSKQNNKLKKRTTLNIFNPKEIDSQMNDDSFEREEQFSVVVERHQPINPFDRLSESFFKKIV